MHSSSRSARLLPECSRFPWPRGGARHLRGFGRPSSIRASRRIRRPLRMLCGASTGTRLGTGLFGPLDSWIVSTWRLAAVGPRLPAPRTLLAVDDRTRERPMRNSVFFPSDPRAARQRHQKQRECRRQTLRIFVECPHDFALFHLLNHFKL